MVVLNVLHSVAPHIAVFDSGLGGFSVLAALRSLVPAAAYSYCADTAVFPYGRLGESDLVQRVRSVVSSLLTVETPDAVVVACNTASTAALAALRADHPHVPFVGVVPAIKPAAAVSQSKVIGLLATPGTVQRSYTHRLIADFAADCVVLRHGAPSLAALAEACLRGETVDDAAFFEQIEPLFAEDRRMDTVVLGCTHYPLVVERLAKVAPWPVRWVDSGDAVARQTGRLLSARGISPPGAETPAQDHLPQAPRQGAVSRVWATALTGALGHTLQHLHLPAAEQLSV